MAKSHHPKKGDLYTIIGPEIRDLLERMRARHESWRQVSYLSHTRLKVLRRWRRDDGPSAISMTKLDELITTTEVGDLRDYTWYTADELVAMGVWDAPYPPLHGKRGRRDA